jgi:hypothetical protein
VVAHRKVNCILTSHPPALAEGETDVSKKTSFKFKDVCTPNSEYGGFVCHTLSLLRSDAWLQRGKDVNVSRLIDFLEIEHLRDGGLENGNLGATHDQLEAFGIQRKNIKGAIAKAACLGLAIPKATRDPATGRRTVTRFRLTYLAFRENGYWQAPLDEWRRYQAPEKIQKPSGESTTVIGVNLPLGSEQKRRKSAKVQVVDVPLGEKRPILPQTPSNTANFDEPRQPKVQVVDSPLPSISCLHSVSFIANGKLMRASSPSPLSVGQRSKGFHLVVTAWPPIKKAA